MGRPSDLRTPIPDLQALRDHVDALKRDERERAARRAANPATAYIRFGGLPHGERSKDTGPFSHSSHSYLAGLAPEYEVGVSVFAASVRSDGALVVDTLSAPVGIATGSHWLRVLFAWFFFEMPPGARRIYRVYGERVGTGGAGEPLLRNCAAVEVPLTTPVVLDSWGPDAHLADLEPTFNLWRDLDGTREGYRTPYGSDNFLEAFAPPGAREVLHRYYERKWRRRRRRGR